MVKKWTRSGDKTAVITFRCSPAQKRELQEVADRSGITLTSLVLEAAREHT